MLAGRDRAALSSCGSAGHRLLRLRGRASAPRQLLAAQRSWARVQLRNGRVFAAVRARGGLVAGPARGLRRRVAPDPAGAPRPLRRAGAAHRARGPARRARRAACSSLGLVLDGAGPVHSATLRGAGACGPTPWPRTSIAASTMSAAPTARSSCRRRPPAGPGERAASLSASSSRPATAPRRSRDASRPCGPATIRPERFEVDRSSTTAARRAPRRRPSPPPGRLDARVHRAAPRRPRSRAQPRRAAPRADGSSPSPTTTAARARVARGPRGRAHGAPGGDGRRPGHEPAGGQPVRRAPVSSWPTSSTPTTTPGPSDARFVASNNLAVLGRGVRGRRRLRRVGSSSWSQPRTATSATAGSTRGGPLVYAPDAVVGHAHAMGLREFLRQHFTYGRGAVHFHRLRGGRASGRLRDEMGFHADLRNWLGARSQPAGPRPRRRRA